MRKSAIKEDVLREICKGEIVSGGRIARKLGVSRTAVWKAVNALRTEGFFISGEADGYILSPYNTRLCKEQAKFAVNTENLIFKEVTASTNEDLKALAEAGAEEFTVVLAREQTAGKGRLGRSFYSPTGGLYFSVLLHPGLSAQTSLKITTAAAVSMAKAIEKVTGKKALIKWVNDIYIGGKKVCGILTEGVFDIENGGVKYAVLGIGVNVGTPKDGFPKDLENKAGALFDTPTPPSLVFFALLNEFLSEFKACYGEIYSMPHLAEYKARSLLDGKIITYEKDGKIRSAKALGIGDNAELIIEENGKKTALSSGEVRIRDYE